jgi:hypothetical protein
MTGTTYVWSGDGEPDAIKSDRPEVEVDGDLFWVWIGAIGARLNHEGWEGQGAACLGSLLASRPELADLEVTEDSPAFEPGMTLRQISGLKPVEMRPLESVDRWYHGATTSRLPMILEEGVHGNVDADLRSWKVADVPQDTVYLADNPGLAAEYGRRAARLHGGDPVVVKIDATALNTVLICDDRGFLLLDGSRAWKEGRYGDCSAASASLTLTSKVGYRGIVPPEAIGAFLNPCNGDWEREDVSSSISGPKP